MQTDPELEAEPANLRFLRRLVTVLTATMLVGLLVLITLIVIRLQTPAVTIPDQVALPEGVKVQAYTQGGSWFAVVTEDNRLLIYDRKTGDFRKEVLID